MRQEFPINAWKSPVQTIAEDDWKSVSSGVVQRIEVAKHLSSFDTDVYNSDDAPTLRAEQMPIIIERRRYYAMQFASVLTGALVGIALTTIAWWFSQ